MRLRLLIISFLISQIANAQIDLIKPFTDCGLEGSITIYDYNQKKWITSDEKDSAREMQPASTFKIINLLIALETGVIEDENEIIKWSGSTDTTLYGYRPDIYKDISVKEAFEVSAGWAFIEIAKRIKREQYLHYLKLADYGNKDLSEHGDDFWNFGPMTVSPKNQVEFLIRLHENKLPFSRRNLEILKKVMITEQNSDSVIRSKTGWTRLDGKDIGWWVGYLESKQNLHFFATRLTKPRSTVNKNFGSCRKDITKNVLRQLGAFKK